MRSLYSAFLYCIVPFALLRLLWRSRAQRGYRDRLQERFGYLPPYEDVQPIWVHAVSVGEVQAASPLITALLQKYPDLPLVVSTTTPTGASLLRERFGNQVVHIFCPWDLPDVVSRALARLRPRILLLLETELWPNLVAGCEHINCPVLLLNARMSPRSAGRYRRVPSLVGELLKSLTHLACQSKDDKSLFLTLGASIDSVSISGNLKGELQPDAAAVGEFRTRWSKHGQPVVVAGSTEPEEDDVIVAAFGELRREFTSALLIIAPRQRERCDEVVSACHAASWRVARASEAPSPADVLVVDTLGELASLYALGDVAFVGGSLVERGGHNLLEPAMHGVPIVAGKSLFNFSFLAMELEEAGALRIVANADALTGALRELLIDDKTREEMGAAGRAYAAQSRGALAHSLKHIEVVLDSA